MWSFQQNIYKTKSVEVIPPALTFADVVTVTNSNNARVTLKNTSLDSTNDKYIDWGDGNVEQVDGNAINHTYASTSNYLIKVASDTIGELDDIIYIHLDNISFGETYNANISNLSSFTNLEYFYAFRPNFTGNISSLSTLTSLSTFELSSDINDITGDLSSLPSSIEVFRIDGNNTISGNINIFNNSNSQEIIIEGDNTISGTLDLTSAINLIFIIVSGSNTITGNVSSFPNVASLVTIRIQGNNTLTGNTSDLFKTNRHQIVIQGNNTITGDISNTSVYTGETGIIYINILGNNTISGNISNLNSKITTFVIGGINTITGDVDTIPVRDNISTNVNVLNIYGNNTITGLIEDLIIDKEFTSIIIEGDNTISGDLQESDGSLRTLVITGNNTISNFSTPGAGWNDILLLQIEGNSSLTSTMIDNLLNYLETVIPFGAGAGTGTDNSEEIIIESGNSRTSDSDAAVTTLLGLSYTITINGITE